MIERSHKKNRNKNKNKTETETETIKKQGYPCSLLRSVKTYGLYATPILSAALFIHSSMRLN